MSKNLEIIRDDARPLIICLIRGHAKRKGGRLCDNSAGDEEEVDLVFASINTCFTKDNIEQHYRLVFVADVVVSGAEDDVIEDMLTTMKKHFPIAASRMSPKTLGAAQTDSLLESFKWMGEEVCINCINPSGYFILRADTELKPSFRPLHWIQKGTEFPVFPFKVWDWGGPADQIVYVPSAKWNDFTWAVKKMTLLGLDTLNRKSLHFIHTRRGLKGKLVYFVECVGDANTSHEWNPFYRIRGRNEAALKPENQAKWIEVWPEAIADESVQCSGQPIVDAKCSGQPIVENSDQWDDDADHDWKVPPTLKGPSFEL